MHEILSLDNVVFHINMFQTFHRLHGPFRFRYTESSSSSSHRGVVIINRKFAESFVLRPTCRNQVGSTQTPGTRR